MIEQKLYNVFFTLLRSGLWNQAPENDCFPINENLWEQVYWAACQQTVEGIIYDGIMQLPENWLPPRELLIKWTARIDIIERRNTHMNKVVAELDELFHANGISYRLLKGQGVANCYIRPSHRVCGDVDWYFPSYSDFKKANKLIASKGISITHCAGFSVSYVWKGVIIDHHKRMFDLHNPLLYGYLNKIQRRENQKYITLPVGNREIILSSPLLIHIQVYSHILKHMLSFGIGLRQLCDSACICSTYSDIDKALLKKIYCKVGIYRWALMLNGILVKYLGMPPEYSPFSLSDEKADAEWMIEEIIYSGNFGFFDQRWDSNGEDQSIKRSKILLQVLHRLLLHVRYVPSESFWFPVMQVYSHKKKDKNGISGK